MSLTDDLARLEELDPATWKQIIAGIPLKPRGVYTTTDDGRVRYHQYQDARIPMEQLMPEVSLVWLQWCLQEATAARGWPSQVAYYLPEGGIQSHYMAHVWFGTGCRIRKADSSAAALLAAYVAALKTIQGEIVYEEFRESWLVKLEDQKENMRSNE